MSLPLYADVSPSPDLARIEEKVLEFWAAERIFERSVEQRDPGAAGSNTFVFYDGPPFANGLPHYGHLVTGYVKDVVPRYKTMRGYHVPRRFGWDCHGLPAELEAERQLGVSGQANIRRFGVQKFNDHCRDLALRYTKEWEVVVTRQARWVDFKNDYKTMDLSYMESVLWAFKELWKKGLIFEGYRVLPYSWAAETPVSNFETRLDNSYRPRQDPALTVAFSLKPAAGDSKPVKVLAWTTTPWTLPSNLALAVGKDIDYAVVDADGHRYVLGEQTLEKYERELKGYRRVGSIKGAELVGRAYEPLFPFFARTPNAFRVLAADFVDTAEGTGIVHIAPGFGEDDQRLGEANDIPVLSPVDERGRFTAEVPTYQGTNVLEANKEIIRDLKAAGVVVKHETYEHNYPHCWRTDTPLIYRAINSWFVRVTAFRDRMAELNQQISWVPEHVRDGLFGNWLKEAQNWSISRNRFWGSPIPVWRSDDPRHPRMDVYGSLDELERDFGVRPTSLHRPYIDELVRPNPDDPTGKSMMRRVEEVFDCWFESGSMSFAQVHYPFENEDWFRHHFPADFITEYVAQTRGWFYTLVVLATALFDKPPFRNAICHGVVLDEDKQKLSKRLRNYPSPEKVFATHGSDALRWFLISSPILRGQNLIVDREGAEIGKAARQVIFPLWNTYYFFTLYANSDRIRGKVDAGSEVLLDRYILAKTRTLVEDVTRELDRYDIPAACALFTAYMDALNNWYVRRSRERFWEHEPSREKQAAYDTLYTVLTTLLRLLAPFLPLLAEEMYRNLTGETSVHLADWPDPKVLPEDRGLSADMDAVRDICSVAKSIRVAHGLRLRLPLRRLTIVGKSLERIEDYLPLIRDEVNVKEVVLSDDADRFVSFTLKVNPSLVGPRLGAEARRVFAAAKQGEWKRTGDDTVEVGGHELRGEEFSLSLTPLEGTSSQPLPSGRGIVVVDVTVTPELEREGRARDLVRLVQDTRKEMGLHVSDRIALRLRLPEEFAEAVAAHRDYIAGETLAESVDLGDVSRAQFTQARELDGREVQIGLSRSNG